MLQKDFESEPSLNQAIKIEQIEFIELLQDKLKNEIMMRFDMQKRMID